MPASNLPQNGPVIIPRYRPAAYGGMVQSDRGNYVHVEDVGALLAGLAGVIADADQHLLAHAQHMVQGDA